MFEFESVGFSSIEEKYEKFRYRSRNSFSIKFNKISRERFRETKKIDSCESFFSSIYNHNENFKF